MDSFSKPENEWAQTVFRGDSSLSERLPMYSLTNLKNSA